MGTKTLFPRKIIDFSGFIWDFDGTIANTQKLHSLVESELLATQGVKISTEEITLRYSGIETKKFFKELTGVNDQILDSLIKEKWLRMEKLADSAELVSGIIPFLDTLRGYNTPMAIASASPKQYLELMLNKLKLRDYFQSVVSVEEVKEGKPAPDIFIEAARRLYLDPEDCAVIEDGISGMIAGSKAGCFVFAYVLEDEKEKRSKILSSNPEIHDVIFSNFSEL